MAYIVRISETAGRCTSREAAGRAVITWFLNRKYEVALQRYVLDMTAQLPFACRLGLHDAVQTLCQTF